ncbi:MAG: hypothetical protein GY822_31965 [Deltaproteobacteria bacterium]|nr:hypothetical protein [Deltaproteobacteria bacterium]
MSSLSQRIDVLKSSRLLRKVSRRNLKALAEDLEECILPTGVSVVRT